MRRALLGFGRNEGDNVGRANVVELGGVTLIIDYAHNPHGMAALAATVVGAAGPAPRSCSSARRATARTRRSGSSRGARWPCGPTGSCSRRWSAISGAGRPGEIPGLMADELARLGVPPDAVRTPGTEIDAVRDALAWARPGDVLLLTVHQDRPLVMALVEHLRDSGWKPGTPLPVEAAHTG